MTSMNMLYRKRITGLFLIMGFFLFCLLLRLAWIQFIRGEELQEKAFENRARDIVVYSKRGSIFDRNMKKLAISVSTESVYAIPPEVNNSNKAPEIAKALAEVLELDEQKVLGKITKKTSWFEYLKRKVDFDKVKKLKDMKLPGIGFVEENQRFYPLGRFASHILGFAGVDNQGLNGLEITYEDVLKGVPGRIVVEFDAKGREIPQATHKYIPPQDGNSLVLTIDESIQYVVERELDKLMKEKQPKSATIIVMDPKTGQILALGNRPDYDPNKYGEYPQVSWRNIAITNSYEPGSTFKIVTASAALEEKAVKPEDRFYDPGYSKIGKETVKCWRFPRGHGSQSFVEGVQNSCNTVFIDVAMKLGKDNFYKYLKAFGFGQKTGIDFPGEATGILVPEKRAKDIDLATMSIGQANAVTPIQLITAVSAVANGGVLMKPQLVKEIRDPEGKVIQTFEPTPVRQVISKETASQLAGILETVVSDGTGRQGYIEGYRAGGKTGTAQKIAPGGGYLANEYVASFVGFAPANDPQAVVLVVVDAPKGVYFGGQVAAPVFKEVMRDTLRYLGVPVQYDPQSAAKENNQGQQPVTEVVVPDLAGLSLSDAQKILQQKRLNWEIQGTGNIVVRQMPETGAKVKPKTKVLLYLKQGDIRPHETGMVLVPDVTGMTIREAGQVLVSAGLKINPVGTGIAASQDVKPGSRVKQGSQVTVKFVPPVIETIGP